MKLRTRSIQPKKRMTAAILSVIMLITLLLPGAAFAEEANTPAVTTEPVPAESAPAPAEPAPAEIAPAPEEPAPAEIAPAPAEPAPAESAPAPAEPAPAEIAPAPAPAEPAPTESAPAPVEPAPAEIAPAPEETAPAESAPAPEEPAPTESAPAPADPAPAESSPAPTEPAPAESSPAPAEPAPAESSPAPAEPAPAESAPVPADPVPAESAPVPADPAPAESAPAPADPAPAESAPVTEEPAPAESAPALEEPVPAESEPEGNDVLLKEENVTENSVAVMEEDSKTLASDESEKPAETSESKEAPSEAILLKEAEPVQSSEVLELPSFTEEQETAEHQNLTGGTETTEPAVEGGFYLLQKEEESQIYDVVPEGEVLRSVEIQIGDHIITAYGTFPDGTELQAVEIPADKAAQMSGKAALFAYDIRLVHDGEVWQPENFGKDVQISVRKLDDSLGDVKVDLLHVKTDLMDASGALSEDALEAALQNMADGSAEYELINTDANENGFSFDTTSFSAYVGTTNSRIVYVYNSTLFNEDSTNYPGVYTTKIKPNSYSVETAATAATIGIESIADGNLDKPTTESPAIIQGAAVGYDNRISATEYELIDPNRPRPEPYSEFTVKIMEEQGQDGTIHKKPSGFDGTYVIVRLDVSEFLSAGSDDLYLHMEQKDNKALMPAATVAKGTANAKPEDYTPVNVFTDGLGNRSASYKLSDLVDKNGSTPYVDVILYATAANVAGADAGQANTPNGDVPIAFYVDKVLQYNSDLVEYDPNNTKNVDPNDPNAATAYNNMWFAKFFDTEKAAAASQNISRYLVKGSDLALETLVENSGGGNKDTDTTYWSLKKSVEDPYYDQEIDKDPNDAGSGRTLKLMSEVAIINGLTIHGNSENNLKKRTLDVNSYDIQIANNTGVDGQTAAEDITLDNAWLTIADYSNTTGAEMAIGNNARFVIDQGGKLIIDETCQLEIEWDGATTTPSADGQTQPSQPDVRNNGQLDLRAGGEIVNNGIITIEGTEGKPYQEGSGQEQQVIDSQKGSGEMTIREGATITNNGALVDYGKLTNQGTLVNNGKYDDVIKSNDPDKGAFDYHKGIQVAWKDDVTQNNIVAGSLINAEGATLINNGDIVLTPGTLENNGTLKNNKEANIYSAVATEAIIPITPDPATPTVVSKRVVLNPAELSYIINNGTLINDGNIAPATVALNDNIGFGALTTPGAHPELFIFKNKGTVVNNGSIYQPDNSRGKTSGATLVAALVGSIKMENDTWLYLYEDGTFLMILPDASRLTGTYRFVDKQLVFTLADGTVVKPVNEKEGDSVYSIKSVSGMEFEFVLTADFVARMRTAYKEK